MSLRCLLNLLYFSWLFCELWLLVYQQPRSLQCLWVMTQKLLFLHYLPDRWFWLWQSTHILFEWVKHAHILVICSCNAVFIMSETLHKPLVLHKGQTQVLPSFWFILLNMSYSVSNIKIHSAQSQELYSSHFMLFDLSSKNTIPMLTYQSLGWLLKFLTTSLYHSLFFGGITWQYFAHK